MHKNRGPYLGQNIAIVDWMYRYVHVMGSNNKLFKKNTMNHCIYLNSFIFLIFLFNREKILSTHF